MIKLKRTDTTLDLSQKAKLNEMLAKDQCRWEVLETYRAGEEKEKRKRGSRRRVYIDGGDSWDLAH